ncbi:DUF1090 domain-containing protein [uncultured Shewanella sp.]|uniref:DUF1090 domain-containing protein n=1 Tax=uncultured Shewanella sp. TaxID=173975 RepID=UPI00262C457D|nr:DUF1090 domain-containing protein [uncultured Shewanella sp.]
MLNQYNFLFHYKIARLTLFISFILISFSFQTQASPNCENLIGCKQKYCEINQQLTLAKKYNNINKVNELNTALQQAKANCTNTKLKAELTKKITKEKEKLAEYDADLISAESAGKKDKIHKYQNKISEKEYEIKQFEMELSKLKSQSPPNK